jgi:hypothetical protein
MSNKDELTDLTNRCKDLVQHEANLMNAWAAQLDARGMDDRAAQCRIVSNSISTGAGSPLWRVKGTAQGAAACSEAEVLRPPTAEQEGKVASGELEYSNRKKLNPAPLSDDDFNSNLDGSQANASRASSLAENILNYCTS